jgi:lambda family phage minor tail protein L|tara:strand:- start:2031 stop:2648 length:618 start_codon:yes stop_codon:yes gene_type:complete
MAIPISELQSITPSAKIELFVMELVEGTHYATGNPSSVPTTYRFHAGTNMNTYSEIIWQGNSYQRFPITAEGFAFEGKGQIPRPTLTMSNLGGISRSGQVITVTDLLILVNLITPHNDLINTKITRLQVLASSLDAANFPGTVNPFGTPNSNELPQEIFFIDRKVAESRNTVQFELVSRLDQQNKKLPKRQVTRNEFPSVGSFIN